MTSEFLKASTAFTSLCITSDFIHTDGECEARPHPKANAAIKWLTVHLSETNLQREG